MSESNGVPDWYPLRTIWEERLSEKCSLRQLQEWCSRTDHFPEPTKVMGRYKLYDAGEVVEWVTFWQRVNAGMGRGKELNA